jgi:hypothetical protein
MSFKQEPFKVTLRTEPSGAQVQQLRPFGQSPVDLGRTPLVEREVLVLTDADMKGGYVAHYEEAKEHAGHLIAMLRLEGYRPYRAVLPVVPEGTAEVTIRLIPE